jgi:serralysin
MPTPTTSSDYSVVFNTRVRTIDALLEGVKWRNSNITYSFPDAASYWSTSTSEGYGSTTGFREPWSKYYGALDATQRLQFKAALEKWSNVAALKFTETADNASTVGDIRIALSWMASTDESEAWAYAPDGDPVGGDIWINADSNSATSELKAGSYGFMTLLHELGHAIGLKHPHETSFLNSAQLYSTEDVFYQTVMSYNSSPYEENAYLSYYPTTPMLYDIQAIQSIYGKNTSFNAFDNVYRFDDSSTYLETIWDAGGTNSIVYAGSKDVTIDLREGNGSSIGNDVSVMDPFGTAIDTIPNVWIAYGTSIHNATGGSGRNTIFGNALNNTFTGGPDYNMIFADNGNDTLVLTDTAINFVAGGEGTDTIVFSGTRNGYTITTLESGFSIGRGIPGQFTSVSQVERIKFADSMVALDVTGNAGAASRLYQAAFDRVPDKAGLGYWINKLDKGTSITDTAAGFFNSPEFKSLYGTSPSSADYINRFYQNVLHRTPDEAGFKYWMNELTNGHRSPVIALAQFSESPENQAQVIGVILNGIEFIPA